MIDQAFSSEIEARVRTAFDEMVPKLLDPTTDTTREPGEVVDQMTVREVHAHPRSSRGVLAAGLMVAASLVGLVVVAQRDTDRVEPPPVGTGTVSSVPGDPNTAEPEWHRLLRPFIPERFEYAALVLRNPDQIRVVAIDPTDGKALEIFIGRGLTLNDQEGATDEVGTWTQLTGSGWGVITPTGFGVEMTCEIGSPARGDSGRNYCEVQGVLPFAMDQIRAAVETMATSIDAAILDADLGVPVDDVALDPGALTELVSSAVPDPNLTLLREMSIGFGDRVFEFGTEAARPTTAVRVLRGLYPSPPATGRAMFALYDDAAAIWMSRADGVAVRLTSTDPSPESLERLEQLGRRLLDDSTLSPNPGLELPATSWPPALATTTIAP